MLRDFKYEERGEKLEYELLHLNVKGFSAPQPGLACNAPSWIMVQLDPYLRKHGARTVKLGEKKKRVWDCAYILDNPADTRLAGFLEILGQTISIGRKDDKIDHCIALDFYKVPDADTDSMQWRNTVAGGLVHSAKYGNDMRAFKRLATRLADVIELHPIYRRADCVISIPGQNGPLGFGERLAKEVAKKSDIEFFRTKPTYTQRPSAKEGYRLLQEHVAVDDSVFTYDRVIIVDDVYRSGDSMCSVARAARAKGAAHIYGLVGAKTLRN